VFFPSFAGFQQSIVTATIHLPVSRTGACVGPSIGAFFECCPRLGPQLLGGVLAAYSHLRGSDTAISRRPSTLLMLHETDFVFNQAPFNL
jgi:hypothetical protein